MNHLYLVQLLVAVLTEIDQPEACDKGAGLPNSLNHQERRRVRVIWEEPKSPQQALKIKWKKRTKWIPRRSLTLKTKLRRRTGFSGIRVGEATHPGPAENIFGWESSGEEEVLETERKKGAKKRTPKKGLLAHARKAARRSRAKKVDHVIALIE